MTTIPLIDALILFGGIQGLVLSAYLMVRVSGAVSPYRGAQRLVALIVAILALDMVFLGALSTDLVRWYPWLLFVTDSLYTLIGPFTLLFVSMLTIPAYRFRPGTLFIFLPAFLEFVYFGISLTRPEQTNPEQVTAWIAGGAYDDAYALFWGAELLFNLILVALAAMRLQAFSRRRRESESDGGVLRHRVVSRVLWTIAAFFLLHLAGLLEYILRRSSLYSLFTVMYAVVGLYFFGLVYVMVFRRKTQGSLFSAQPSSSPIKYERSALDAGRLERYAELIDAAMREKELFLCSDLRLSQLADAVSLPANHVSQVINQVRRKNFFDYINGFRVEEAKRLMIDPDHRHWKLLAISLAAGFSSKSTFNKAFKDTTGLTPSSFLRSEPTDTNR